MYYLLSIDNNFIKVAQVPACSSDSIFKLPFDIFRTIKPYSFLLLTYKNVYQFKHAEQKGPDNSQLRMSFWNCVSSICNFHSIAVLASGFLNFRKFMHP
jgi:hypothetical protein